MSTASNLGRTAATVATNANVKQAAGAGLARRVLGGLSGRVGRGFGRMGAGLGAAAKRAIVPKSFKGGLGRGAATWLGADAAHALLRDPVEAHDTFAQGKMLKDVQRRISEKDLPMPTPEQGGPGGPNDYLTADPDPGWVSRLAFPFTSQRFYQEGTPDYNPPERTRNVPFNVPEEMQGRQFSARGQGRQLGPRGVAEQTESPLSNRAKRRQAVEEARRMRETMEEQRVSGEKSELDRIRGEQQAGEQTAAERNRAELNRLLTEQGGSPEQSAEFTGGNYAPPSYAEREPGLRQSVTTPEGYMTPPPEAAPAGAGGQGIGPKTIRDIIHSDSPYQEQELELRRAQLMGTIAASQGVNTPEAQEARQELEQYQQWQEIEKTFAGGEESQPEPKPQQPAWGPIIIRRDNRRDRDMKYTPYGTNQAFQGGSR